MQTALSEATVPVTVRATSSRSNRNVAKPAVAENHSSRNLETRIRSPSLRLRVDSAHPTRTTSSSEVEPAIAGNHLAIHAFMQRLLHRPSVAEFYSATQRPDYLPSERLIIKSPTDRGIIAHVQLEPQSLRFGSSEIPIVRMRDLAVLPEFRNRGYDSRMILAAEAKAKSCGAMMIVARGEDYELLKKHGWTALGSDPVSVVSPQRLLGQLPMPAPPTESPFYAAQTPVTNVRIGRLTDAESLGSIYEQHHSETSGTQVRSPQMWSWLLSKQSHDRIYIFSENGQDMAYVVMRGGSVPELVDLTNDGRGAARLIERVAADAIELGRHTLRIHAPLTDHVHHWADLAGGQVFAAATEDVWMAKCLSNRTLLRRLAPEIHRRRPKGVGALNIRIGNEALLVRQGVRSMKVTRGNSGTQCIALTNESALQLFLGYRTVEELSEEGRFATSGDEATRIARELFPPVVHWRTRWDDMPALNS